MGINTNSYLPVVPVGELVEVIRNLTAASSRRAL